MRTLARRLRRPEPESGQAAAELAACFFLIVLAFAGIGQTLIFVWAGMEATDGARNGARVGSLGQVASLDGNSTLKACDVAIASIKLRGAECRGVGVSGRTTGVRVTVPIPRILPLVPMQSSIERTVQFPIEQRVAS